ncbi:MAG: sporulation protein YqfD [Bacilli bacterium]|nr:sporulation protein YqfD [Bacilli bacterium]
MKTYRSINNWVIKGYKPETVLNKLQKIEIFNFKNEEYISKFESPIKNKKIILEMFPNAYIEEEHGLLVFIRKKLFNISLIVSLIISFIFFYYLKGLIINIEITGDYPRFEENLLNSLESYNLNKYSKFPTSNRLIEIENEILNDYYDQIEFLEIRRNGSILKVKYTKRRKGIDLPSPSNSIYASKDGIIKQILVKTGVVEVSINQYVKKGDLLINDTLIDTNNNEIFIGCEGKIYAYTWYLYEINYQNNEKLPKDEVFIELIDLIRNKVNKNIDGEDEYIEKENVLQFEENASTITLKVHYTLVEDITR